jgi:hypothetical protein
VKRELEEEDDELLTWIADLGDLFVPIDETMTLEEKLELLHSLRQGE